MKPSRVLLLHDYAGSRGGAELLGLDLRKGLLARGIDARLMTTTADARTATTEEAPEYLCKGTTGIYRALREAHNRSARAKLEEVLRDFQPDVVQVLMFLTALSPSILPPLRDIPTVYMHLTFREVCPSGLRWRSDTGLCDAQVGPACRQNGCFNRLGLMPRLAQMRRLEQNKDVFDRSVAPSQEMARILKQQGWPVTDMLPFGVPPADMAEDLDETPVIAYAGRLQKEKGISWVLYGFAHAGSALRAARIEIVGDGPAKAILEAQAKSLGVADRVQFHGKLDRKACEAVLARACVQVVPSLWPEPFGLVTAESLTRGTPVIVTDQGAPSEMVDDGKTGWVVPVGDIPGMAARLVEATSDRSKVREMGKLGRQTALERYDMDKWVDGYLDIYSDLLASYSARTSATAGASLATSG